MSAEREITHAEWVTEAVQRFGRAADVWAFACPACGFKQSIGQLKASGVPETAWAFSCIGRWSGASREAFTRGPGDPGPCNYAGGGLFRINPVLVRMADGTTRETFEFAEPVSPAGEMGWSWLVLILGLWLLHRYGPKDGGP